MSGALATLQFLRPAWLWALLALPLIVAGWWWQRRRDSAWRQHVDPHLLPHLLEPVATRRGLWGLAARLLGWTLAVVALAGPSWRQAEVPLQVQGRALVIALDLSDAMLAPDLPPSRLLQARAKLAALLAGRSGGETALLAYADDAYTVAPLSADPDNIALFLDALAPDVMPQDGQRPDRAIEAAVRLLRQAGQRNGDVLLVGNAADAATVAAAARARAGGYRVSVLGLGRPAGASFHARDGALRSSRLDAASLQRVAQAGGGRYVALEPGGGDLEALGVLDATAPGEAAAEARGQARIARDEGWWLLPPLMLLALLAFRRGAAVAVLAACLLLPVPELQAAQAPQGTAWRRADQVAHDRANAALQAYREGRYAEAAQAWGALAGADAAYNRGNALAREGRLEEALEAYDAALRSQPGMDDAVANRAVVEAALRRQPPSGGGDERQRPDAGDERPGSQQDGGGQSPAAQGEPPDGQGQGEPQASAPQSPQSSQPGRAETGPGEGAGEPPAPADAQSQREADAAQRQRMQQALDAGGTPAADGERVEGEPGRAEDAAERERRQATDAWLRRVPDDPGGLLRARFLLEHRRRHGGAPP